MDWTSLYADEGNDLIYMGRTARALRLVFVVVVVFDSLLDYLCFMLSK